MEERAPLCLLGCQPARDVADRIGDLLEVQPTPGHEVWFASGEGKYVVEANLRGTDAYIVQRCVAPDDDRSVYDHFLMALHAADAARLADADRVTLVLPYLPGTRQDKRKGRVREGVSTGLFARMIQAAGVSMVITVRPHTEALVGCYDPRYTVLESVRPIQAFAGFLSSHGLGCDVVASTDVGGLEMAREYAEILECDLAALSKERDYSKASVVNHTTVLGEVDGRDVLIVDDIVDTAGSVVSAVHSLWQGGAQGITVATVHPLMSGPAWERLTDLAGEAGRRGVAFHVAGTSSVHHPDPPDFYRSFALESLLAKVIGSINARESVRALEEPG